MLSYQDQKSIYSIFDTLVYLIPFWLNKPEKNEAFLMSTDHIIRRVYLASIFFIYKSLQYFSFFPALVKDKARQI